MHRARVLDTTAFVARTYRTMHSLKHGAITPQVAGQRLADDACAMGPLYVKMAQFISARRDAADADLLDALAVVQDSLPLGPPEPPTLPGLTLHPEPIGRASIADVYRGVRDGDGLPIVVKHRRPGVADAVRADLPLLQRVMRAAATARMPGARNMCELIAESESMVLSELDFTHEAAAQAEFRRLTRHIPWLRVPRVFQASESHLVAEYVPSRRLADVVAPNPGLARRLMDLYMQMLDLGYVHADPHPGNLGVLPGGAIVLYDFGAMLRVDDGVRQRVAALLQAGLTKDAVGVIAQLEGMGVLRVRPGQDLAVRRVVRRVLQGDVHAELQQSPEFTGNGARRVVRFGQTFIYLTRTLTLIEGSCRALDPGFEYDYGRWVDAGDPGDALAGFARDVASMPSTMQTMQRDMEDFQARILGVVEEMERGSTALTASLVAACLFYFLLGA